VQPDQSRMRVTVAGDRGDANAAARTASCGVVAGHALAVHADSMSRFIGSSRVMNGPIGFHVSQFFGRHSVPVGFLPVALR